MYYVPVVERLSQPQFLLRGSFDQTLEHFGVTSVRQICLNMFLLSTYFYEILKLIRRYHPLNAFTNATFFELPTELQSAVLIARSDITLLLLRFIVPVMKLLFFFLIGRACVCRISSPLPHLLTVSFLFFVCVLCCSCCCFQYY